MITTTLKPKTLLTLLILSSSFLLLSSFFIPPSVSASTSTSPNLKVAFIGDSGVWSGFDNVLNLIKTEGAQAVVHLGDFDYEADPTAFQSAINAILGANFPYFYVVGNHDAQDADSWRINCPNSRGCYAQHFSDRMNRLGIPIDLSGGNLNNRQGESMYSLEFEGLKIVSVGLGDFDTGSSGIGNSTYAPFINSKLSGDDHTWKICAWHMTQRAMQMGTKGDSMGWGPYEACRQQGAIIATSHEHSYERTKTLSNIQNQTVDSTYSDPNNLRVEPGKTFAFVSGLGGASIRNQDRCRPTTSPYGCKGEWASIYTSDQGATHGALFITFNVGGDPNRAEGYFKNVQNQIIDQFTITTNGSASPSPSPSPNPETHQCQNADLNSDNFVDLSDYSLLATDFFTSSSHSDINGDNFVDLSDYTILVNHFLQTCNPNSPLAQSGRQNLNGLFSSGSWNIPASQIPTDSANQNLVNLFYQGATSARPGNVNLAWREYTFPIYVATPTTPPLKSPLTTPLGATSTAKSFPSTPLGNPQAASTPK